MERGASLPCSSPWRRCFQCFTTECVSCGLFIYDLYHVEVISFCSEFVECFYRKRMLNFVRCFFCIHSGDHAVSGLCSVNEVCYIDGFSYIALGQEDPLEKAVAPHTNILAWRIPWTEKPGRLQSKGLQRVGHD